MKTARLSEIIQSLRELAASCAKNDWNVNAMNATTGADMLERFRWKAIKDATPPLDGRFVEMRGDSGYIGTPYRIEVARYEGSRASYPFHGTNPAFDEGAWRDLYQDRLTDGGDFPTHWRMLTTELD